MEHVFVVQLARMGDLIQSLYLLEDLERQGVVVGILIDSRLKDVAATLAPWIDEIHTVDVERYLKGFRRGGSWIPMWEDLSKELRNVRGRADRIVNLNYGRLSSAMVATLFPGRRVEGFFSGDGTQGGDRWASLFTSVLRKNRRLNRFNLVDVMRFYGGRIGRRSGEAPAAKAPRRSLKTVGIQLGSRSPKRTWYMDGFVEIVEGIRNNWNATILLLGDAGEKDLGQYLTRKVSDRGVCNLVGATDFGGLVEVLDSCDVLITGDTGTMHLAAWLNVPVIAMFMGPAYVFETGPYGYGHTVLQADRACSPCGDSLECATMECKRSIRPETVVGALAGDCTVPSAGGVRVYRSESLDGWYQYRPVVRETASPDDVVGYLLWGLSSRLIGEAEEVLPRPESAATLLTEWYALDPDRSFPRSSLLDDYIPGERPEEQRKAWKHALYECLQDMRHEAFGNKPHRTEKRAAGGCRAH